MQIYLLSIAYMVFSSLLLLLPAFRPQLSFMLRINALLKENRVALDAYFFSALTVAILLLFFPASPGPVFIGDLLPALAIIFQAFYFRITYSEKNKDSAEIFYEGMWQARKTQAGMICLAIALAHFLLPSFVML